MTAPYSILDANSWPSPEAETLGTKSKAWLKAPDGSRWLYKKPRPATGDAWAEKVAAELANLIDLPHATVELGLRGGIVGSLSLDFTRENGEIKWRLAPGNELFSQLDPMYPRSQFRGVREYSLDRVLDVLIEYGVRAMPMRDGTVMSALDVFSGYLVLDAWIANQDRHHENWGVLFPTDSSNPQGTVMAPSFDHASSLGQGLMDEERAGRLASRDKNYVIGTWAQKARGALFADETSNKPMLLLDAVQRVRLRQPSGVEYWIQKLAALQPDAWSAVLGSLPDDVATPVSRRFAGRMLSINRDNLLRLPPK